MNAALLTQFALVVHTALLATERQNTGSDQDRHEDQGGYAVCPANAEDRVA